MQQKIKIRFNLMDFNSFKSINILETKTHLTQMEHNETEERKFIWSEVQTFMYRHL